MTIMTKRGQQDNIVTYEHICDATADLQSIDPSYTTLGSVAIVLNGESGLEVYMANSSKEWTPLLTGGGGTSGAGSLSIYICTSEEVDNSGLPDVELPDENTIYLVASGADSGNLYEEYVYVNNAWEKFGSGTVDLQNIAATTQEVQAIITEYEEAHAPEEEDDDGMVIETEFYQDPNSTYNRGWVTVDDAEDIAEYARAGKYIVFHLPANDDGWLYGDEYIALNGIVEADGENDTGLNFSIAYPGTTTSNGTSFSSYISGTQITSDGKLFIQLYID